MPSPGEANLVAVLLSPPDAADAVVRVWDDAHAVLPLDPRAPAAEIRRVLDAFRPTHLLDIGGLSPQADGVPVEAGTAAVVATSGTTGTPKGVVLTRTGMEASAHAVAEALGSRGDDRWLCCLPLHHVAGLAVVARAWLSGVPPVVHPRFDPAAVADVARSGGAGLVSVVPVMLRRLLDAGAPLDRFRWVLVGGSPLPPDLEAQAADAGVALATTYGLTETWGGVVHDGHPLRGVRVRLGEREEIVVDTAAVMAGYRLDGTATAAAFTDDGRLRTGDVGAFDDDGRLRVVDRLRDLVVSGGANVSPTEVEGVLVDHPAVADVCVSGAPDPAWGERVVAHVVPADPADPPTLGELRDFARERLAAAKLPRELRLIEAVPRSTGGKPLRRHLHG